MDDVITAAVCSEINAFNLNILKQYACILHRELKFWIILNHVLTHIVLVNFVCTD